MPDQSAPALDIAPAAISGVVYGGQQPITGATISVYAVGSTAYGTSSTTALASTTSSATTGAFSFSSSAYTCPASNTPLFLVATGGNSGFGTNSNIVLLAMLGQCTAAKSEGIVINEITTAASVYAMAQFLGTTLGSTATVPQVGGTCTACATGTYNQGLVAAMEYTYPELVLNSTGLPYAGTASGPTIITTEYLKIFSLANIIASCVNTTGETSTTETTTACGKLFTDANATAATTRPYTTLQAALMIALHPYFNVNALYDLGALPQAPFPGLTTPPNDWTLGISYRSSSFGLSIAENSSSNIDIDTNGNVWFPTNKSGATGIGYFSPSGVAFHGPYATTLTDPQYVAIDINTTGDTYTTPYAWATDLSSNKLVGVSTTSPTTSISLTSTLAFDSALFVDKADNILMVGMSAATGGIVEADTVTTARSSAAYYDLASTTGTPTGAMTTGATYVDYAFTSNGGGTCYNITETSGAQGTYTAAVTSCVSGGMASTGLGSTPNATLPVASIPSGNEFCFPNAYWPCTNFGITPSTPEGLAPDGAGHLWVANSGNGSVNVLGSGSSTVDGTVTNVVPNDSITTLSYIHNSTYGNTMSAPYGIAIDRSGNVWTSNAGCVSTTATSCTPGSFVLSEIVGAAAPTPTPLAAAYASGTTVTSPTN